MSTMEGGQIEIREETGGCPDLQRSQHHQNPYLGQDWSFETYEKYVEYSLKYGGRAVGDQHVFKKPSKAPTRAPKKSPLEPVTTTSGDEERLEQVVSSTSSDQASTSSVAPDSTSSVWSYHLLPCPKDSPRTIRAKLKRRDGGEDANRRNTL